MVLALNFPNINEGLAEQTQQLQSNTRHEPVYVGCHLAL